MIALRLNKIFKIALVFALLINFGCVSTSEMDSLKSTVAHLQVQNLTQKKEIEDLRIRSEEQSRETARLRERFEGVYALRESQTNLLSQTSDFSKELQVMKGRFDENKYFLDKTLKDITSDRELQQAKIAALEKEINELKSRSSSADKKPEVERGKTGEAPAAAENEETIKDQRLYDDAQIDFKDKKYLSALQKFEKFIKDNPDHKLASNSQYWIAEIYYNEKKYEEAILAYETFIKKYPKHDKIRAAMLKQGYCFIELGDRKTGKVILERIIERYPRTSEADLAEKKIAELLSQNKKTAPKTTKKKRQ